MPSHKQGTVNPPITDRTLGSSDTNSLKSSYGSSPVYNDLTEENIRKHYQDNVLNGTINDGGHTFGTHNTDYEDAPDMNDVETGGEGKPASPYVPNPVSPGEGSVDPSDQADPPENFGQAPSATPFVGVGSQLSPKASSEAMSKQTLGDYGFGKSTK